MQNCHHCNGHLVTVEQYEHGVRFQDHRCLMCGRYWPIQTVTAQVDVVMVRETPSNDRQYAHICRTCGAEYQHKWKQGTYYCSKRCNYMSTAKIAGEIKRGRRAEV